MANEAPQADKLENPRGATWMHEDLAEYIKEQTGYAKADPVTIRLAFALRNEYRKTDRYKNLKAQVKADKEREAEEARKAKAEAKKAAASEKKAKDEKAA